MLTPDKTIEHELRKLLGPHYEHSPMKDRCIPLPLSTLWKLAHLIANHPVHRSPEEAIELIASELVEILPCEIGLEFYERSGCDRFTHPRKQIPHGEQI